MPFTTGGLESRAVASPAIRTRGTARQLPTRLRHSNYVQAGEKPYLMVHVGLRAVPLEAAGSCVEFGSGGPITQPATLMRLSLAP